MKQAARNIAGARVDTTARISSIRRQDGDGDVNLADVWPTITRVGSRGTAKRHAGSTAWKHAGVCVRASAGGTARERAGSTAWTSAGSTAGKPGPPYRQGTWSPLRRRGVTVPGLMSTIRELQTTRTNQEA